MTTLGQVCSLLCIQYNFENYDKINNEVAEIVSFFFEITTTKNFIVNKDGAYR